METTQTGTGLHTGVVVARAKEQSDDKEDAKVETPAYHWPYHSANIPDSA